ncbi:MAG TPA: ATP-binding protein, partial [Dissulfurispiraceae bacterium]|nr:ATP-binding protein [Dissulfurispiraceae bacterium]
IEEFNNQQLVLARHAASQIENRLNSLTRELLLLSYSPSVQYSEASFMNRRMRIALSMIQEEGCLEIRFVEEKNLITHVVDREKYHTENLTAQDRECLAWGRNEQNKGKIMTSDVSRGTYQGTERLVMKKTAPVWQVSVDDAHPVATNKFSGVLCLTVDATALVDKVAKGIRSGKTGYSWVIDNKGTFLYHPEIEFIGKTAFEARMEKRPTISFARINEIQKDLMMAGKEGMSQYISGWHRGQQGEIKKMIAYTPIKLERGQEKPIWSVAVVAPISEIAEAIRGIQVRQFFLEGAGILVVLCGGLFIMGVMLRWSSALKSQVEEKTKELLKSETQCRTLVENAYDIIFTVDREGMVKSMNKYGYHFFSKIPQQVLNRPVTDLFPENMADFHGAVADVFRSGTGTHTTPVLSLGNEMRWLSINFSSLLDENNEIYAVLGIARDMTKRKKLEEQMTHTEKLASVGTLAAGVAHEINNPLTIILGFTDMLLEKSDPDSEVHDLLHTIEKQGLNAKRVVENLLSFARKSEHKETEIDINENIETVLAVVRNNLNLSRIAIERHMAESLPKVKGDAGELQQVFFNIVSNAIPIMKGGGTLAVSTDVTEDKKWVEVRISDTGPGIPKDHRAKIFDPFFTTKKVGEGTGLGLSITYGIVTKHGGTITFETKTADEAPVTGTTFIIRLPALKSTE